MPTYRYPPALPSSVPNSKSRSATGRRALDLDRTSDSLAPLFMQFAPSVQSGGVEMHPRSTSGDRCSLFLPFLRVCGCGFGAWTCRFPSAISCKLLDRAATVTPLQAMIDRAAQKSGKSAHIVQQGYIRREKEGVHTHARGTVAATFRNWTPVFGVWLISALLS